MQTEIYIENYRLDISDDISALITFAIDDVKDFSERSTAWSKTIVLPGTANNNKLFGHIFEVGQSNAYDPLLPNVAYNFNASKAADCLIFQDNIQAFKGVIRLMQVNIEQGRNEYEVSCFGELAGLNVSLSSGLLEDLDFSAYDVAFTYENVVASWDNTPGSGVYFPLIDFGTYSTDKHSWDIHTFRPALYVKEYIDKMFSVAGYRYSSALFQTARFKSLIIPHNQKEILQNYTFSALANGTSGLRPGLARKFLVNFDFVSGPDFALSSQDILYNGTNPRTLEAYVTSRGTYNLPRDITFTVFKNTDIIYTEILPAGDGETLFGVSAPIPALVYTNGDLIKVQFSYFGSTLSPDYEINVETTEISFGSQDIVILPIPYGDTISINNCIPKNVRQIDFLLSIVKLFNLYVYEDKFDQKLIYITPYVDFYPTESSGCVDWTYKLNRDKVVKVRPMSEINAKIYEFKFKQDSDYYNELYRKRYGSGYGDFIFDSEFEFAEQKSAFEVIFSSSPIVGYNGEEKIYPTIFKRSGSDSSPIEEKIDSNIRIMQSKKVTGVTSWNIMDGVSILVGLTSYGYAGHLDDPDAPGNDLNFGALKELFFTLSAGSLSANQFNVYWSSYMAEITDKDSKLLSGWFYLQTMDIFNLDFSRLIMVDGVLFRLNQIINYNMSTPQDCECELLRVIYLIY